MNLKTNFMFTRKSITNKDGKLLLRRRVALTRLFSFTNNRQLEVCGNAGTMGLKLSSKD